jgi:phosphoglycerol transferase MdoB-like AlkP superfamily enzyme
LKGWKAVPSHLRVIVPLAGAYLAVLLLARVAFYAAFARLNEPLAWRVLAKALWIGTKFDVRLVALTLVPIAALGWLRFLSPVRSRIARRLWIALFSLAVAVTGVVYAVDFGNYAYLRRRLDARALDLVQETSIALGMVWETYPVIPTAISISVLVGALVWLFGTLARREAMRTSTPMRRWQRAVGGTLVAVVWIACLWGKAQWYPLRWSDAFFSTDAWSPALALNPVLYVADTFKNRETPFDPAAVAALYPEVAHQLGVINRDPGKITFERACVPLGGAGARPNVVVILMESLGYYECGRCGNPLKLTPSLDALAEAGQYLPRFYVPAFGTARSVFALVTGIPDVEGHETSTRNPLIVTQRTVINDFHGYKKFYFLGGSLNWANVRGILAHNIPDLSIFEEGSYEAPRVDTWGVSDLAMFEKANAVLRTVGDAPFFAILQTSGNHQPYHLPADTRGFVPASFPQDELERAGFTSNAEINALRFLDHSIGFFMATAQKEKYFERTIFVLLGDHGYGRPAKHLPGDVAMDLIWFHVPLVIVGRPLQRPPAVVEKVASEVDVMPTVASLAGVPYTNTTLGRDLFDPQFDDHRFAFTYGDQLPTTRVGVVSGDTYVRIEPKGTLRQVFDLNTGALRTGDAAETEEVRRLAGLAGGLYQTSRYMLYHNAPPAPGGSAGK